jgi:hypothetical protein
MKQQKELYSDTISFTTGATSTMKLPVNIFPTSVTFKRRGCTRGNGKQNG